MFDYAIKNNFFDEKDYLNLKQQLTSIEYDPPPSLKRGAWKGPYWHERTVEKESEVGNLIKKKVKEHFNFIIKQYANINFTMVGAKDFVRPHIDLEDGVTHQCIIYIAGNSCMDSGTGFFFEDNSLDTAIGFRENKAIFFNSKSLHSPLHALKQSGEWRYSIATFFS